MSPVDCHDHAVTPDPDSPTNSSVQQLEHHLAHRTPASRDQAPRSQPPSPHGTPPRPNSQERPRTATTAAILGIVSASLALPPTLGAAYLNCISSAHFYGDSGALLGWVLILITLPVPIALLIAGITFLKGRGYAALLSSAVWQIILTTVYALLWLLVLLNFIRTVSILGGFFIFATIYTLTDLGLTVSSLVLLRKPATRQWAKQVS